MLVKLLTATIHKGKVKPAGATIEVSENDGAIMVSNKQAEALEGKKQNTVPPKDPENPNSETGGEKEPGEETGGQETSNPENTVDREAVCKALDNKYNRDPLYDKAKEMDIEIAYNAKKGDIINAIIDAGKADVLV